MTKWKKLTGVIATGLVVALTACGTSDESTGGANEEPSETNEEAQEVTLAVVQDYPPFEYVVDGELTGFDIDIVEAIAEEQNLDINWQTMKFDGIIPALQADQVDAAVSAITIRDDRAEVVDFTAPYFESGLSLVVPADSDIESVEDLEGKTIVGKQGTSGLEKAREFAEEYNGSVTTLQEDALMYMEIASGNADALINDYPSVAYKITTDGEESDIRIVGDRLTGENYGIAVSKGAEGLLEKFDAGLSAIKENGTYDDIYSQYFSE